MTARRAAALRTAAVSVGIAVGCVAIAAAAGDTGKDKLLLPNLDQAAPAQLRVRTETTPQGTSHLLGFTSRIVNQGPGPLIIRSARSADEEMRADQVITLRRGGQRTRQGVGVLRYVRRAGHEHWHVIGLQRFALRTLAGRRLPRRVAKQGLCLGDREPAKDPRTMGVYTGECGLSEPGLLRLTQGLSRGWSDPYYSNVEGQEVDITTLRDGRYVLVHRADPGRRIAETDESDNAASVAVSIRRRAGGNAPRVKVLRICRGGARCRP